MPRPFRRSVMLTIVFASLHAAHGATLNVPAAYPTIQAGLDAAHNGDTVLVAPGTYTAVNIAFKGKSVLLKSSAGPAQTIIDGNHAGTIFVLDQNETRASIIDGFTIRNGFVAGNRPGGIYIRGSSPTIRNNILRSNRSGATDDSSGTGGAILVVKGATGVFGRPLITGNSFIGNVSGIDGGAIYIFEGGGDIISNTFDANKARPIGDSSRGSGGAIQANRTPGAKILNISYNTFTNNSCKFAGGAISVFAMAADVKYNRIENNDGGLFGGGVHLETQASFGNFDYTVVGNTIVGNKCLAVGGGIHTFLENTTSKLLIDSNTISQNSAINLAATSATSPNVGKGGGIGSFEGRGLHTIRNNILNGNRADVFGGAFFSNESVLFYRNHLDSNSARFKHGGLFVVGSPSLDINANTFTENGVENESDSVFVAGALAVNDSTANPARIRNNIFARNTGTQCGALSTQNCTLVAVHNNTFVNNATHRAFGGTIYIQNNAQIINNIFLGDIWAARIAASASGDPTVVINNNDFLNNTTGLVQFPPSSYANVTQLNNAAFADNNLSTDPQFFDAAHDNFRLMKTSPVINQGAVVSNAVDFETDPRPRNGGFDIGADEFAPDLFAVAKNGTFYLDRNGSFRSDAGDGPFAYGQPGDQPLLGDWNGDGFDSIGVKRGNVFYLRNSNSPGNPDITFTFGAASDVAVVGDWNGDGIDTIGLRRGATYYLRDSNSSGAADYSFAFGRPTDDVIFGDFDGNGTDTLCLRRGNRYYIKNSNTPGPADAAFSFGSSTDVPIFGDWNGAGIDTVGVYRSATGELFIRFSNTQGSAQGYAPFGVPAGVPFTGIF
jgi:hypothetical protein